ncbi:sugar kinase [Halothermothrix orenii]|uniref:PfkB domain protein n=1 Tax=Halothermothrix orenii (strain H 168 / OCM 544 / DSM 9562) TaxID=373903 RepID=B8D0S7_HALOH|nr:sugar kinase [Halothermothrix orenii]ACL71013.1 PfkB domain protein [Halothermothrix orenii H 168]
MPEVITIGEVLVEVMAREINQKFSEPGEFVGPFPSGAPAIFIDQVAKMGVSCGIISKVGNDDFGYLNQKRLEKDGVDTSYLAVSDEHTTGVAFVTYMDNGDREFIFHLKEAAPGYISEDDIDEGYFEDCKYLHLMGCSLFNKSIRKAIGKALDIASEKGVRISFDPNVRKELLQDKEIKDLFDRILDQCYIFLPGEEELKFVTGYDREEEAIQYLRNKGVEIIAVKKGRRGSKVYTDEVTYTLKPFKVEEVDPTGAGDTYDGALIASLVNGKGFEKALRYASAAGALAVTTKGPMEGTRTVPELDEFIKSQQKM